MAHRDQLIRRLLILVAVIIFAAAMVFMKVRSGVVTPLTWITLSTLVLAAAFGIYAMVRVWKGDAT